MGYALLQYSGKLCFRHKISPPITAKTLCINGQYPLDKSFKADTPKGHRFKR